MKTYNKQQLFNALHLFHKTNQRGSFLDALGVKANVFLRFALVIFATFIGIKAGSLFQVWTIALFNGSEADFVWVFIIGFIIMGVFHSYIFLRFYTKVLFWKERAHVIEALKELYPEHTINKETLTIEGIDLEKELKA